jgi:hypothetical protein
MPKKVAKAKTLPAAQTTVEQATPTVVDLEQAATPVQQPEPAVFSTQQEQAAAPVQPTDALPAPVEHPSTQPERATTTVQQVPSPAKDGPAPPAEDQPVQADAQLAQESPDAQG